MNILIAEDDPTFQMTHRIRMGLWGYNFDLVANGKQVVEYAQNNEGKYDCCLMGVEIPKINGIEATKLIRQTVNYLPILAFSSVPEDKSHCLQAGMDDFLDRPCLPDRLRSKIDELTVKVIKLFYEKNKLSLKKEIPMNSDELKELRELKKQGLTKLKLIDFEHTFVVHKNIQNKISHDLVEKNLALSEFIDRSPSEPGRCHLYKENLHITKDLFLPEELEEAIRREDEMAMGFNNLLDKYVSDEDE